MGKTRTPTYRVEMNAQSYISNMGWDTKYYGRPTTANLTRFIAYLNNSDSALGIAGARIVRQATGEIIAEVSS